MADEEFGGGGGSFGGDGGDFTGPNSYTETTTTGWFSRIGQSFVGVLVGFILFLVSFPLHYWNEGRAIDTARALQAAGSTVVSVPSDKVDPANDQKLVHTVGKADIDKEVNDPTFGITQKAVLLVRNAEMYQWHEKVTKKTTNNTGGSQTETTTTTYEKRWDRSVVNSGNFKDPSHRNPTWPPAFQSQSFTAEKVTLGAFVLPSSLVRAIQARDTYPLSQDEFEKMPQDIRQTFRFVEGQLYAGKGTPSNPQVGDIRVAFQYAKPTEVSVMAQQAGDTFRAHTFPGLSHTIEMLSEGNKSAKEMQKEGEAANNLLTWILRLVGFVIMAVGLMLIMNPLKVLADVLPFLGSMVGFVQAIFAFMVAAVLTLITIAICWIIHRPMLAILLLVIAGGIIAGIVYLVKSRPTVKRA